MEPTLQEAGKISQGLLPKICLLILIQLEMSQSRSARYSKNMLIA